MQTIKKVILAFALVASIKAQTPEWINFYSGPANIQESIEKVVYDSLGNTYFCGYGYYIVGGQGTDFITMKCDSNGVMLWAKVFNGAQNKTDRPNGIAVDISGNVYVAGTSQWTVNNDKIVVLKYSAGGDLLWRTIYDSLGTSDGEASDIIVDNNGNILVTGGISPLNNSYYDLITIKLNSDGFVIDQNLFGQVNNQPDVGQKIITTDNNDVYAAGYSFSGLENGNEVVLIKYDDNLSINWIKHINGTDSSLNEFAVDLCIDDTGNVYLLSRIQNLGSSSDFALLKFDSSGQQLWRVEYDEATINDNPADMYLDDEGNVYVAGSVKNFGYYNFIVLKYNNAGIQQWKSYFLGDYDDLAVGLTVDMYKNVYLCGEINPNAGSHFKFNVVKFNSFGGFAWNYLYDINESSKAIGLFVSKSGMVYSSGIGKNPNGNIDFMTAKISNVTSLDEEIIKPNQFKLNQNYPNPFNPTTKIKFSISDVGTGLALSVLKVYDILGNEVATLVNEEKPAGVYEVEFDASNLSSGTYFYRLTAGEFSETKKLMLIK